MPLEARAVALAAVLTLAGMSGCEGADGTHYQEAKAAASALRALASDTSTARLTDRAADSLSRARQLLSSATSQTPTENLQARRDSVSDLLLNQVVALQRASALEQAESAAAADHLESLGNALDSLRAVGARSAPLVPMLEVLAWPLVVVLVLALLIVKPDWLSRLLRPIRSVRVGSSEVVLSEQVAVATEDTFAQLRHQATKRFRSASNKNGLGEAFVDLMHKDINDIAPDAVTAQALLRATLHVPDIVLENYLAQAIDYWPAGGGRGRAFPVYFGIIGKAWRLHQDFVAGDVPTDPDALVLEWGMTYEEARGKGKDRHSFAAILLKDNSGRRVGILYMDCKPQNAFGRTKEERDAFAEAIRAKCAERHIPHLLASMLEEVRQHTPPIAVNQ